MLNSITKFIYQGWDKSVNKISISANAGQLSFKDGSIPKSVIVGYIDKKETDTIETIIIKLNERLNSCSDLSDIIKNPNWQINIGLTNRTFFGSYMSINWTTKQLIDLSPEITVNDIEQIHLNITHAEFNDKINPFATKEEQEKQLKECKDFKQRENNLKQLLKTLL